MERAKARIKLLGREFHSLIAIRNGKLIVEEYFTPSGRSAVRNLYSGTKSVLSTLCGIALAEGNLPSLDTALYKCLPDKFPANADAGKKAITLEQLLDMSSGFPQVWMQEFTQVQDPVGYMLGKPLVAAPGSIFLYNSGTLNVLSAVLQRYTGKSAEAYAKEKLFDPLEIKDWKWSADPHGVTTGGTNLSLRAVDFAKIGYLYLRKGDWFGTSVVSAEWIARATTSMRKPVGMSRAEDSGYGYLWWVDEWGGFSAHGASGQFCFVVPRLDLVVVMTAALPAESFPIPYDIMKECILPSVE